MTNQKLWPCHDCAHPLSANALTCPNCGRQVRKAEPPETSDAYGMFVIALWIWNVVAAIGTVGALVQFGLVALSPALQGWAAGSLVFGIPALLTRPR